MKKIKIFAFLFLSLFVFGISSSFAITATFTGDNQILAWWGYNGSVWTPLSLDSGKSIDWKET
ncbi:MAG: hypothetical protein MUP68_10355, partial [Deltaproteobacteria bacterium]|nr:hypothetical protein [Deltaproteobacteria bacterium]